jgi:hypothetical protein
MPPLFTQPVFRRVKAQPSCGGKRQYFGVSGRKGRAFPQSKGRRPQELSLIWTAVGKHLSGYALNFDSSMLEATTVMYKELGAEAF